MKYSYQWLQEHLDKPLPQVDELVRTVTIKSFEVEGVEEHQGDTILEMKVLPDRAHDALSHRGMAREVAALFGLPRKERALSEVASDPSVSKVRIAIEDATLCPRYIGVRVDGIRVEASPEWLSGKITAIGGRSINNVVDLTNYVLFDIGQPMHAFDAAKVAGGITVRLARAGETMTTLDGKPLTFDGSELVIADDEGVLALAGVKGGKRAEVDGTTTSIIFESANFDPALTRRTSTKHGIKTDASKRYENGMTSEFAGEGMSLILSELTKMQSHAKIGEATDVYPNPEKGGYQIKISGSEANHLLGGSMDKDAMEEVLHRLGLVFAMEGDTYLVTIPVERLDLRIKQDLIEEIGRNYGYHKIEPALPKLSRKGVPHKRLYYANKVRKFLVEEGFSEVFTYSFATKSEVNHPALSQSDGNNIVEVLNPVGKDRPYLRRSLLPGLETSLIYNHLNAPLLEIQDVFIFEFGDVFSEKEQMSLAFGVRARSKKKMDELYNHLNEIAIAIGEILLEKKITWHKIKGSEMYILECNFSESTKESPDPGKDFVLSDEVRDVAYKPLSIYPFIVRDIAIFVPQEVSEEYIETLLKKEAGDLVVRFAQFDKFQKPGESRISYAYRMVFQSFDRTLTDDEVGAIMERVTFACNKENNWQVR